MIHQKLMVTQTEERNIIQQKTETERDRQVTQ